MGIVVFKELNKEFVRRLMESEISTLSFREIHMIHHQVRVDQGRTSDEFNARFSWNCLTTLWNVASRRRDLDPVIEPHWHLGYDHEIGTMKKMFGSYSWYSTWGSRKRDMWQIDPDRCREFIESRS